MNEPEHQRFPDGTRVRFTDEAREAMRKRPGTTRPLRTPADGPDAVYTADNTDDGLHDVVLRDTGERYGTYWLQEVLELDEAWDMRRRPILQSVDQLRDAFPGLDDPMSALTGTTITFRMRGGERLLAMRRLGWADAHPPIVAICGSTRFRAEMAEANRELTLAGCMVLAPGVFAHDGDEITEEQKAALDELHLRKIDLADQVLVVDPGGYVGESTRREIAYAEEHGKPVSRLNEESTDEQGRPS